MGRKKKGEEISSEHFSEEILAFWSGLPSMLSDLSEEVKQLSLENYEKEDQAYARLEDERIKTKIAKQRAKARKYDAETIRIEAKATSSKLDNKLRRDFSNKIYWLLAAWMTFIAATTVLHGAGVLKYSTEVLITLLSSTTVTVVGIFMVVARNIFPLKNTNSPDSDAPIA